MFIDVAKIYIKAGDGGNGAVSFHREKYVAAGGPDGGDGGRGGNVVFVTDEHLSTLLDFRYKKKYAAVNGENGKAANCYGKDGPDLVIRVPKGTIIKDRATGMVIKDLSGDEPFVAAKGGNGGWGNSHFATPTRQAPRFAKSGQKGQDREITLELKLLADVGLIGFPNVGKSTFLSVVSAARPKIANYHFTTLIPQLGVVKNDDGGGFVIADIPGLIEGAAEGVGLGHDFLRHVERCRLLVHIVDISGTEGRNPIEDFKIINGELERYAPELSKRPQIVVGNKSDVISDETAAAEFEEYIKGLGLPYYRISAATRAGINEVINAVKQMISVLPPVTVFEPEFVIPEEDTSNRDIQITFENGTYIVTGDWLLRVLGGVNFDDYESLQYFEKVLRGAGIYDKLEQAGAVEGSTVSIYGIEFEYVK